MSGDNPDIGLAAHYERQIWSCIGKVKKSSYQPMVGRNSMQWATGLFGQLKSIVH